MTLPPKVDYRGIRFTPDHVAILDRDDEVVTIPLDRIRALTLRRGFTAERPLAEALLGVACCGLATLALRKVLGWFMRGGTLWDIQLLLVLLLPLGLSLLRDARRPGFYLRVELNRCARKFPSIGGLDGPFRDLVRHAELLSGKTLNSRRYPRAGVPTPT